LEHNPINQEKKKKDSRELIVSRIADLIYFFGKNTATPVQKRLKKKSTNLSSLLYPRKYVLHSKNCNLHIMCGETRVRKCAHTHTHTRGQDMIDGSHDRFPKSFYGV